MKYELRKILPEHILHEREDLVLFVEEYLHWLNDPANPAYVINNMPDYRDIDRCADEFLEYLQREFAASIPETISSDRRKLYKNVVDIYLSKGSTPSYQALFNLAFNDKVELHFPRVEILKPSDGKWDNNLSRWANEDGMLSAGRFIQDSRYYQSFSYVIKTGQTIGYWRSAVKRLLHPSGFAFFGRVAIVSEAIATMKKIQPGRIDPAEYAVPIIIAPVDAKSRVAISIAITFTYVSKSANAVGSTWKHIDMQKFNNSNPISVYKDTVLSEAISGGKTPYSSSSEIIIS
jgi:hypothetical protein